MRTGLAIFLICLMAGCATTLPVNKNVYTITSPGDFLKAVNERNDDYTKSWLWLYAGSDADYDYVYGYIGEVFPGHNYNYTYYRIKTGEINVGGARFAFPNDQMSRVILNDKTTLAEMNTKFGLTGNPSTGPISTASKTTTP